MSRVWVGLLLGALVVVGCSDAAGSGSTSPVSISSTTEARAVTSTTEPGPETTTTGAPAARFGVVAAREGVLGWWDGNSWVQAQNSAPIEGTEAFRVFRVGSEPSDAVGVGLNEGCAIDEPAIGVDLDPDPWAGGFGFEPFEPNPIALSAPWDATPHTMTPFAPSDTHAESASALLLERGVDDPSPKFAQLLRTDVDGDGVNEVFAVAERRSDPSGALVPAPAGDYSIAFVRTVADDVVNTQVLAEWIVVDQTEEGFIQDLVVHRFDAFLDADDDGTDEVALRSSYYEGSGVTLWDRQGTGPFAAVISTGCGA